MNGKRLSIMAVIPAFLISVALALLVAPGGYAEEGEKSSSIEGKDRALDRALKGLVAMRGGPPGAIAVVQRGGRREVHAFGVGNIETGRPMKPDDRMRLASTSKAFSGATALALVSKGALSLDDTIGERIDGLPESWEEITLRQLLNHTSGLPNFTEDPDYQAALVASLESAPEPRVLLSYVEDEPLEFDPGTDYRYSNTDNIVVGLMVESATGRTYEGQLQEQVFGPLGMNRTSLPRGVNIKAPFIHGYDNDPDADPPEDISRVIASGWVWSSGGMVSTPGDLNTFARGYARSALFDRETRAMQRRVVEGGASEPPGPGKNSAGLGIFRYETVCGTVWGHTGNFPGYTQFFAASADGRRSVTVSVNEQLSPVQGAPGVFDALRKAEGRAVCAALAE